jgi:3',5'-cyclic AMP phosphodiesterase CpdA
MSDLHFSASGEAAGFDPAALLGRVLDRIERLAEPPAFCVVSGDLADDGSEVAYRAARALLNRLEERGIPILAALGNHDDRAAFRRGFLEEAGDDASPYSHARVVAGVGVAVLDSSIPGELAGEVGPSQLAWLEGVLREPTPLGWLVVLHHCCRLASPTIDVAAFGLRDGAALEAVVARHAPWVLGVLASHSHQANAVPFGGTIHATAPGVLCQFDYFAGPGPDPGLDLVPVPGSGFNLCRVSAEGLVVHPLLLPPGT